MSHSQELNIIRPYLAWASSSQDHVVDTQTSPPDLLEEPRSELGNDVQPGKKIHETTLNETIPAIVPAIGTGAAKLTSTGATTPVVPMVPIASPLANETTGTPPPQHADNSSTIGVGQGEASSHDFLGTAAHHQAGAPQTPSIAGLSVCFLFCFYEWNIMLSA